MSKLFVVYDTKGQSYSEPMSGTVESVQQFLSVLVNTHSEMPEHVFPSDFALFEIAEFDSFNASLQALESPKLITSLAGLRKECSSCVREKGEANEER